nr:MAG TPA: virulence associated protein E [Caudoviricetes sp.]
MIAIGELVSFYKNFQPIKNSNGTLKVNSPVNVLNAFRADDQLNLYLKHNEFSQEHELTQDIQLGNTTLKKGELPSNFESVVKVYFENVIGAAFTSQAMLDGMETFLSERSYNPVKEYMENARDKWDKKQRINKMLQVYLGAEDKELISKIATMWLVGAVAKVYEPYVKFDYVLDLVGGQGVGKTSFLQKIGGQWYTDAVTDFANKDNYDIMLKHLIVNDDEMVASDRMSFAETKSFISKTSLRFRKPYMRRTQEFAKNFVLARTSNHIEYLKDKTGERRFLPVLANNNQQKKHPMNMTPETVEQIWGEAVTIYEKGFDLMFDDETEKELHEYREQFMFRDEIEIQVLQYLEMPVPQNWESKTTTEQSLYTLKYFANSPEWKSGGHELQRVSTREIMFNIFRRESNDQKLSKKISFIMDNLQNWEKQIYKSNGKTTRGYKRILI